MSCSQPETEGLRWASAPPFRNVDEDYHLGRSDEEMARISREIDEQLLASKKALERKRKSVQILLLVLNLRTDFHLTFAPKDFDKERVVWRTIVQLNLIGSLRLILDILARELGSADTDGPLIRDLRRTRLRFSPLLFIEQNLMQLICPDTHNHRDVCVRPGTDWKGLLRERLELDVEDGSKRHSQNLQASEIDPTAVLVASKSDLMAFWGDPNVRAVLKKRGARMEEMSGL
ncbi:hypothetical protein H0H92_002044 [Tricholoma furcatifolium]|nr:hypothetical protein H0H92_002044 [Tricholoma furcatifolium]